MTEADLIEKIEEQIRRAKAYRNPLEDSPFAGLGASSEYVRGGIDALEGVLRLLREEK